jgi:two-component system, OmpR family, KDP operon response regulator KdpE
MSRKTILIVDDDPYVRQGTRLRLRAGGFETLMAADVVTTLSKAERHHPDLILLDLGLPGSDGYVVIDKLKANPSLAGIPIIVVSGRDIRANQPRAIAAGAKAFLQKPVDNAEFLAVIRHTLGASMPPVEQC